MKIWFKNYRLCWLESKYRLSVFLGLIFLVVSLFVNNYAQVYAFNHAGNSVSDILLDNIPAIDVHVIYSEGAILFVIVLLAVLLYEPRSMPFVFKSLAVFIVVRSFFMILTHFAPPPTQIYIDPTDYIQQFSRGSDLFFSGHTGFPFLTALIFWKNKYLRYFFLIATLVGGTAVIMGHLHYSIDVFSALFISYGIFHASKYIFPRDYRLLAQAQ